MSSFCLPYAIQCAERAARVEAANVQERMKRGVTSLASISATAALFGFLGTAVGILNAFRSINGPRSGIMADIARRVSEAMTPGFLGLSVALVAFWFHRYLVGQLRRFDVEMKAATGDLAHYLLVYGAGLGAQDAPRFGGPRIYRHALLELIWPRLVSDGDRDSVLRVSTWVCFAYGVAGFLVYWDLHRVVSGWVVFCFFAYAGWLMRRQPVASAVAVFGYFAVVLVLCFLSPFALGVAEVLLGLAPVLLIRGLKAGAGGGSAAKKWVRVMRSLVLAGLYTGACAVVWVGTIFALDKIPPYGTWMYPTIRPGDWVVAWMSPPTRVFRGELLETGWFPVRVIGLPGDRVRIEGGILFRNGAAVREPYANPTTNALADFPGPSNAEKAFLVPEGRYFVLNDNRSELADSRNDGTVPRKDLGGRLILAWSPERRSVVVLR
jgi:signal peptidase I